MVRLFLMLLCAVPLAAGGCANRPAAGPTPAQVPDPFDGGDQGADPSQIVSGVGRIVYVDLEGGFYGLIAEDSTRYNPINLGADAFAAYREDGLRVRFRAVRRTDLLTTRMWGLNIELLDLLPVEVE